MAQAVDQHIPIKDLDGLLRYLEDLGYSKGVAAYMMNQSHLRGQLQLEKQECVRDGEPYGGWIAIDAEFGHLELDRHGRMRVVPRIRLWREVRYRIAEHCDIRAIWSPEQLEDKTSPDPVEAEADDGLSSQESKAEGWQVRRVKEALKERYPPDGHPPVDKTLTVILKSLEESFKRRRWKLASLDTLARAIGRRGA